MGKNFVEVPDPATAKQLGLDWIITKNEGTPFGVFRNDGKPGLLIDRKTGNIDIRAKDGTSLVKIDAVNKTLYLGENDLKQLFESFKGFKDISTRNSSSINRIKEDFEDCRAELASLKKKQEEELVAKRRLEEAIQSTKTDLEGYQVDLASIREKQKEEVASKKILEASVSRSLGRISGLERKITSSMIEVKTTKSKKHLMIKGIYKGSEKHQRSGDAELITRCYSVNKKPIFFEVEGRFSASDVIISMFLKDLTYSTVAFESKLSELGVPQGFWPTKPLPMGTIFDGTLTVMPGTISVNCCGEFTFCILAR